MGSFFASTQPAQVQPAVNWSAADKAYYDKIMAERDKFTRNEPYNPLFLQGEQIKKDPKSIVLPMLKDYETFQPRVYDDGYGNPTIGYGMRTLNGKPVTWDTKDVLTQEQADSMLGQKVEEFSNILKKFPTYNSLKPNQQAALIDLAFNIGPNFDAVNKKGKPIYPTLSAIMKDPSRADELKTLIPQFRMANGQVSKGLINRRADTLNMFSDENYNFVPRAQRKTPAKK